MIDCCIPDDFQWDRLCGHISPIDMAMNAIHIAYLAKFGGDQNSLPRHIKTEIKRLPNSTKAIFKNDELVMELATDISNCAIGYPAVPCEIVKTKFDGSYYQLFRAVETRYQQTMKKNKPDRRYFPMS